MKTPDCDRLAEARVVGAVMAGHAEPDEAKHATDTLRPSAFVDATCRQIWEAILASNGITDEQSISEATGIPASTLCAISENSITSGTFAHWVRRVHTMWLLRRAKQQTAQHLAAVEAATEAKDPLQKLAQLAASRPQWAVEAEQVSKQGPGPENASDGIFESPDLEALRLDAEIQPQKYLIETMHTAYSEPAGVMPAGRVGMLAAEGGAGKTWAAIQLAVSMGSGHPWLDSYNTCSVGDTFLGLGEEERQAAERRFQLACRGHGMSNDGYQRTRRRVDMQALAGRRLNLIGSDGPTDIWARMVDRLDKSKRHWSLIVLDPLSRWGGRDVERDESTATDFIAFLEQMTELRGNPTVLVLHHTNKASRGGVRTTAGAARGTSALTDGVRWQANIEALLPLDDTPPMARFRVSKSNLGVIPPPVSLVRDTNLEGRLRRATKREVETYIEAMKNQE